MTDASVQIAGGGIGGLALALTLHQIGIPAVVYEGVRELKPLGVGINLQPNAVRELFDLGITEEDLKTVGIAAQEWALLGLNGREIYSEPRGTHAGYKWPQYAVHRGEFHMLLYQKLLERAGPDAISLNSRVVGYEQSGGSARAIIVDANGNRREENGSLLIGADGIHSAVRAQMHPDQAPIHWGGAMMWRGKSRAKPLRTQSSFIGLGSLNQRMIIYPISQPDEDGFADVNWIAEVLYDDPEKRESGWFREVATDAFIHHFADWKFDWLDVPALIEAAPKVYENPMIDRDPVSTWVDGRVALLGDAAHAMYPTGSNGASQAIMDGRTLGAKLLEYGVNANALRAYDDALCKPVSELVLRNRGAGPFAILGEIEKRCGGVFDDINDVISEQERDAFMASYKTAAGFDIDRVNASESVIPSAAKRY